MVICLERGADLHMGPADATATHCLLLHLNPDWFCLLVPAHLGSPRQRAVKRVCVCMYVIDTASIGLLCSWVYVTIRCLLVRLSLVCPILRCSRGVRRICCCGLGGREISMTVSGGGRPAAAAPQHGVQQQM